MIHFYREWLRLAREDNRCCGSPYNSGCPVLYSTHPVFAFRSRFMRLSRGWLSLAFLAAAVSALPRAAVADGPIRLSGETVTVIDGDTFQAGGTVIQLAGIDAPEPGQVCENDGTYWPCGMIAAYGLRKILSFEQPAVTCYPGGVVIASCEFGDTDISRALLLDGNATALVSAPHPYQNAQQKARNAKLGIWRGPFIPPGDWRAGKRLQNEPPHEESHTMQNVSPWRWGGAPLMPVHEQLHSAFLFKATRSAAGERLYHSPLDTAYGDIAVDTAKGDRYFCSDDDARKAGWRRPGELPTAN
jgi:endonuclease YncB( thermonuclease family)